MYFVKIALVSKNLKSLQESQRKALDRRNIIMIVQGVVYFILDIFYFRKLILKKDDLSRDHEDLLALFTIVRSFEILLNMLTLAIFLEMLKHFFMIMYHSSL